MGVAEGDVSDVRSTGIRMGKIYAMGTGVGISHSRPSGIGCGVESM